MEWNSFAKTNRLPQWLRKGLNRIPYRRNQIEIIGTDRINPVLIEAQATFSTSFILQSHESSPLPEFNCYIALDTAATIYLPQQNGATIMGRYASPVEATIFVKPDMFIRLLEHDPNTTRHDNLMVAHDAVIEERFDVAEKLIEETRPGAALSDVDRRLLYLYTHVPTSGARRAKAMLRYIRKYGDKALRTSFAYLKENGYVKEAVDGGVSVTVKGKNARQVSPDE